ncbi:uncharacterized protein TNCV_4599281 [Trichonephila clavipes]|nr:uncharacterized protein TNCV_4599281 [Trichonephila clavipes]
MKEGLIASSYECPKCNEQMGLNERKSVVFWMDLNGDVEKKWLATPTAVPLGLGSNLGEDMDVCKCKVSSRHGGTLNSHRAASSLVRLVEGEERWEDTDQPQGVLPQNWGETKLNRSVTCMMLKATAKDRLYSAFCHD